MDTMQSWFGLKEEHREFTIDYDTNANLFFARHDLDETLKLILRRSARTGYPPKFVLYGDWGIGKTHTMRHTQFVIESTKDLPATVVFVELPDITSKSSFQVAHAALLDALGIDRARSLTVRYNAEHGEQSKALIQEATQSGDIAMAFMSLIGYGDLGRIAWDWLRGLPLSASDARLVGLAPVLNQSLQLVKVLQMLGRLSLEVDEKMLVYMLDEATKLGYVSNQDAINHWLSAFKTIADSQTKEFGFIVSGAWTEPDDMPLPLLDQQVQTRFGAPNYIQLQNLDEQEGETFLRDLLAECVDPNKRTVVETTHANETDGESIDSTSFPFTEPALRKAVEYFCRDGGITTPRDIQTDLGVLLNRAIDEGRHILSLSYMRSLIEA